MAKAMKKAAKKGTGRTSQHSPKKKTSSSKPTRKKAARKKAAKKTAPAKRQLRKASAKRPSAEVLEKQLEKMLHVEPGPPAGPIPSVEEPAPKEEAVGVVTHFYSHLNVIVVQVNQGRLRTGDQVRIKGHTSDFSQQVGSLEHEHQHVDEAEPGQSVGMKVEQPARVHDIVYVVH